MSLKTKTVEVYDIQTEDDERQLRIKLLRDQTPTNDEVQKQNFEVLVQYYLDNGPLPRGDRVIYATNGKLQTGTRRDYRQAVKESGGKCVGDVSWLHLHVSSQS